MLKYDPDFGHQHRCPMHKGAGDDGNQRSCIQDYKLRYTQAACVKSVYCFQEAGNGEADKSMLGDNGQGPEEDQ